ncbi:MAG: glycosyltransferase family 4 protein [Pseudomonadota bacterium]
MRFLYSHRTRSADGQYVHIAELTRALIARGHEIHMVGPAGAREAEGKSLDAGSSGGGLRERLPGALYEMAEALYSVHGYRRLSAAQSAARADILYERYNLFYHAGAWLKARAKMPMILEVNAPLAEERAKHGDLALKSLARKSEEAIWRAADAVLPVTDVLADYVRAAGVDEEKIHVIQNGVGHAFLGDVDGGEVRRRYGLEGKLVLGFTGFVRDWHGVDRAVRYLAGAGRDDMHLLLVGDGPARTDLEALAATLGVADRFTVTGVVQRDEMAAHVAAFDIALQPAVVDYASPLKLFEYMALARAVIAPASPNIVEVLRDGDEAALFKPGEEGAFEAALDRLVADDDLRARVGAAARTSLDRQNLTWAGNARRVEEIASALLEGK